MADVGDVWTEESLAAGEKPLVVIENDMETTITNARKVIPLEGDSVNEDALFQHGGRLVRLGRNDSGRTVVLPYGTHGLMAWFAERGAWVRRSPKDEFVAQYPDERAILSMLERADMLGVPVVRQIVTAPTFTSDGSLVDRAGYSKVGELWYEPDVRLDVPPVPVLGEVRVEDRDAAVAWLVGELLVDFPFAAAADRAHALALVLEPFVRPMIRGATPLYVVDAPTPGSGKTLLTSACLAPACGTNLPITSLPTDEAEIRKELASRLAAGHPVIWFDNVWGKLRSSSLAAAITAPPDVWSQRVLGASRVMDLDVRCTWIVTGNNVDVSLELARRSVRIRLDPNSAHPWRREGFRHRLPEWALERRGELVWAALVLVRWWQQSGSVGWSGGRVGGLEEWSSIMGGVVEAAGGSGFMASMDSVYDELANETGEWEEFVELWWSKHRGVAVGIGELLMIAASMEGDPLGATGLDSRRFGWQLRNRADSVVGDWKVVRSKRSWVLKQISGGSV